MTTMMGNNHHFFRTLRKAQNSLTMPAIVGRLLEERIDVGGLVLGEDSPPSGPDSPEKPGKKARAGSCRSVCLGVHGAARPHGVSIGRSVQDQGLPQEIYTCGEPGESTTCVAPVQRSLHRSTARWRHRIPVPGP